MIYLIVISQSVCIYCTLRIYHTLILGSIFLGLHYHFNTLWHALIQCPDLIWADLEVFNKVNYRISNS